MFDSTIVFRTNIAYPPDRIKLWRARNTGARDFRMDVIGEARYDSTLAASPFGQYTFRLNTPEKGWEASFVEVTYENRTEDPLKLTTGVLVLPESYPFEPFKPSVQEGSVR